jgi:hypothetical protein
MNGNSNMYHIGDSKGGEGKNPPCLRSGRLSSEPGTERLACVAYGHGHQQPELFTP